MFIEFVQQQFLLFIALGVISLMLIYSYVGDRFLGYKQVSPEEATRLYNRGALMLDVRSDAEYKTGFLGEAKHIPVGDVKAKLNNLDGYKNKDVIVYCQSGARSAGVANTLVKNGFQQVHNLRGGIMAWKMAGLPVNQPVSRKARRKGKA
jgi:rhodanese-related sulfurtransferase